MGYTGSVDLVSGIRPKNNGTFPLVDAKDVRVDDNTRLDAALEDISVGAAGAVRYDTTQTLTDEQKQQARENIGAGEVDDTLSVEGMAADAKKTGDKISALKGDLNGIENEIWPNGMHEVVANITDVSLSSRNNYIPVNQPEPGVDYDIEIEFSATLSHISMVCFSTTASSTGIKENFLSNLSRNDRFLTGLVSTEYSGVKYILIQFDSSYGNDLYANIHMQSHEVSEDTTIRTANAIAENAKQKISEIKEKFDKKVLDKDIVISGRTTYYRICENEDEEIVALIPGQTYHITLTFSISPSVSAIYTHRTSSSSSTVDDITSLFIRKDEVMECDYTPESDSIKYIRIALTAAPSSEFSVNVQTVATNYADPINLKDAVNKNESDISNIEQVTYKKSRMKFGAHQGSRLKAPQNSIPAYIIAGEDGWDYLWLARLHCTTDHVWYVMHDDDVSDTTDGTGNISEMTATEVNALHIDTGVNVEKYSQEQLVVPTAEKAIQIANRYGMNICFRIADMPTSYVTDEEKAIWDSFINLVKSYEFEHAAFSGNIGQITCLRSIVNEDWEGCYFGTGTENADTIISYLSGMNNVSVILQYSSLTLESVKKLHRNGIKVYAYSTTPSNAELVNASDMGVDIFQNAYAYKLNMPAD